MTFAMVSIEYLAGFIDGEGYLALGRIPRRGSTEYPVRMVVYNTNLEVIEAIRSVWGGTVSCSKSRKPGWKDQYALIWTNAAAANLLEKVAPYLRIKAQQAATLLDFQSHIRAGRRSRDSRGRLLPMSSEEQNSREAVYQYLKRLNARGPQAEFEPKTPSGPRFANASANGCPSSEYLAGFIDGEGSLMINRVKARDSPRVQYRARIAIGNTNRAVLEDIQASYGGILVKEYRAEAGWKHLHQLVWTGGMLEQLLDAVGPYLRIKREQTTVMRAFLRHMKNTPRARQGPRARFFAPLPEDVVAYRESLCVRMKELNARGVPIKSSASIKGSDRWYAPL